MEIYKFDEILNDLMDYFILGDAEYLLQYKLSKNLPDDLLTEFTAYETGDEAVEQGVFVPMIGVENYPYTIYFNLSNETPELLKPENILQHRKDGYCLMVKNEQIHLYTMPYLMDYTEKAVDLVKSNRKATMKIKNGWYSVAILAGLTKQINENIETMEPTFEFIIKPVNEKPNYTGDFMYKFSVE